MILGTCPIQKLLLSASPVQIETAEKNGVPKTPVKNQLVCSYGEELVKAPLIALTKKSDNNALYFILVSTFVFLLTPFVGNGSIPFVKRKNPFGTPVPLFLKNQVFII